MRNRSVKKAGLALLLALCLLLPACQASGETSTDSPSGAAASGNMIQSDLSSPAAPEKAPFRSQSDKEAKALFGGGFSRTRGCMEGDYSYFIGNIAFGTTVYRYHRDTGEISYACPISGCAHDGDRCPLYDAEHRSDSYGRLCVLAGKILRVIGGQIVWQDMQTGRFKKFTVTDGHAGIYLSRAGDAFYYTLPSVYDASADTTHPEVWKITVDGEGPTLVLKGAASDCFAYDEAETVKPRKTDVDIFPCRAGGKECFIVKSYIGPDGESIYTSNLDLQKVWLYRVESGSEERQLIYEKPVPNVDRINYPMVAGDSLLITDCELNTTGEITPKTFHLVNLSTGEDKILAEAVTDVKLYQLTFTDRCLLYLCDDPAEKYGQILCCYDAHTGEKKEYPLQGKKCREGELFYDGGLLYYALPGFLEADGVHYTGADLVVWDIATGAMRHIINGKLVQESR